MRHRIDSFLGLILCFGVAASALFACADTNGTGTTTDTPTGGNTDTFTLSIVPSEPLAEIGVDGQPDFIAFRAFMKREGELEVEVTKDVNWTIDNPSLGTIDGLGHVAFKGHGGKAKISATYEGVTASTPLTVKLRGDVYLPGTDENTKFDFGSAFIDPNTANAPLLEYPEDGVVLPANLPPIEAQWTAGGAAVYRVRLAIEDTLDVTFYTTGHELAFPADLWAKVRSTAPDAPVTLELEGLDAAGQNRSGT
jgi:hypothetical protein